MRRFPQLMLAVFLATALMVSTNVMAAPPYLLLRTNKLADGYGVTAPRYSYGWFGAGRYRHKTRHYGYYNNYTQWSYK